ncbi:CAF1-domain-containing protein [Westerdykella ornata]|uniref:CAF1-domain-containing protein n=1 Tax=Westerdykella ornata TaxID=318751 RepID=A0A6A6JNV9_WESOR|nr:CAF1-domain-containing protein [Westerdykella ornata]KAF2277954.1 CAF1-domain-containing protein [Westerdykella ornata]
MEVDAISFPNRLLGILIAISEADFVSFDLELSGIPSRIPGRPRARGRQSLEDRYVEAKAGAERHQILQVGLTCAKFDYMTNKYILRPYNFNISPLIDERLDIEREITFQTGAIAFLLKNDFRMDLPFTHGVQYLSRDEAYLAKQLAYDRIDKKNVFEDMQLKETDVDSLDFVHRVRQEIIQWTTSDSASLSVTTHTGMPNPPAISVISRFEKRLVYQLLRAEFPHLVAIGRNDCIKIVHFDALREEDNKKRMKSRVKEQISRQTGFRWIVEALARGHIDIDPIYFAKDLNGEFVAADLDNIKLRFDRARMRLRDQQPVLVGHNMFTDLVYFYRSFIGELPDTLKEFCEAIHELFPRIVDTKYLATHDGGDLNASPTLQDIAESLETQELPDIVTHADHPKYHESEAFHEAGFDAMLTAAIMLRLSTKLHAGQQASNSQDLSASHHKTAPGNENGLIDGNEHVQEPIPLPPIMLPTAKPADDKHDTVVDSGSSSNGSTRNSSVHTVEGITSRFASTNVFQSLEAHDEESPDATPDQSPQMSSWKDQPRTSDGEKVYSIDVLQRRPMEMLPEFESMFWHKFGNKLRVFGTEEAVLKIAEWEAPLKYVEVYDS